MPVGVMLGLLALSTPTRATSPSVSPHALTWFVHEDLVDGARTLSFWTSLLEQATEEANALLEGGQGPSDTVCCTRISVVSVSTFSNVDAARDLLTIDDEAEWDDLDTIGGTGARAFLVDSLNYCGGPGSPLGCAQLPACSVFPDTSRSSVLTVGVNAWEDYDRLGTTIAHERGHNACLVHVVAPSCSLMLAVGGGGCLTATECTDVGDAATGASGDVCGCHDPAQVKVDDGVSCTDSESSAGLCSGGMCGTSVTDAAVELTAAAGTAAPTGDATDEQIAVSGLTGDWTSSVAFPGGLAVEGMAYAPGRDLVYAVAPSGATTNDLYSLDPWTGVVTLLGSLSGFDDMVGLAFDPGATSDSSDDRLLALALHTVTGTICRDLVEIHPDTLATTDLGFVNTGCSSNPTSGFQGLAYDSKRQVLYATAFFSSQLWTLPYPCGDGGLCTATSVDDCELSSLECPDDNYLGRADPALAYSEASDRLYVMGHQSGNRLFLDSFDAGTLAKNTSTSIDPFSVGGLAARPVDRDGDGVADTLDNCTSIANAGQLDTDADGCGNVCDSDYDQNGVVGTADFAAFRGAFQAAVAGNPGFDPAADAEGDEVIGTSDFAFFRGQFQRAVPGPSLRADRTLSACP
ncbi:thrombospondin type 3 repeat-containing protein [Myxococcota bacterium]|nr:thrombospondin type 3 repeat-containing protein [Myxococcota bacterium]